MRRALLILLTLIALSAVNPVAAQGDDCAEAVDYLRFGMWAYQQEDYEAALYNLTCAIEGVDPDQETGYLYRALTYRDLGDYEQANRDLDSLLTVNPQNSLGYMVRGSLDFRQGQYEQAIADYEMALELDTDVEVLATLHSTTGEAYLYLEDTEQALFHLNQALELNPERAVAYAARGFVYEMLGDVEQAESDWQSAVSRNAQIADDYFLQGNYRLFFERYNQAVLLYSQGITLAPDDPRGYHLRGIAFYEQGDYGQAVVEFTRVLQVDADFVTAQAARQQALIELSLQMVLEPDNPEPYRALGDANYIAGNLEAARINYSLYLDLAGDDADPAVQDRLDMLLE